MTNQRPAHEPRPNREIDKRPGDPGYKPYSKIPDKDRILCKVRNLMFPGEQIEGCINGVTFSIKDDIEVMLHSSQIGVLQDAIIETTEYVEDAASGQQLVKGASQPKYMVQVIGLAQALAIQEAVAEKNRASKEAQDTAADTMEAAGAVDQAEIDGTKDEGVADGDKDSLGFLTDEVEETKEAAKAEKAKK